MLLRFVSIFLACTLLGWGQNVTATITGTVRDGSGAVLPNAVIKATNTGTQAQFEASASSDGAYVLRNLPVGVYKMRVEVKGFQPWETD